MEAKERRSAAPAAEGPEESKLESKPEVAAPRRAKRQAPTPVRKYDFLNFGADLQASKAKPDDPRVKRIKEIKKYVQFREERFTAYEQSPLSPYDLFQRQLRSNTTIAQKACQSNEDDRTVEVQTEDVQLMDKEVQFQLGDDTQFENLLSAMQGGHENQRDEALQQLLRHDPEKKSSGSLANFLQMASHAMESLP